jgi:hypothetical protein
MVYVPAGVTAIGGLGFEPPSKGMARPAPHPVVAIKQPSSTKAASSHRRFLRSAGKPNGNKIANQNILGCFLNDREKRVLEETPVSTVTETVVVVPSATVEGVTLQVEFAGVPAQVKVAVPGMFAAELSSNG